MFTFFKRFTNKPIFIRWKIMFKEEKKNRLNDRCGYLTYTTMLHIILFFTPLSIVSATNIWPVKFSSMNKLNKIVTRLMSFFFFLSLGDPHASAKDFGWCEKEKVRHESNLYNRDWFRIITTACSEPVVLAGVSFTS